MSEHRISLASLASIKDGTGHSVFGASSSHMYLHCAGSLIPNIMASDDAGIDAAFGTVAHSVTETWLRSGRRPDHLIGTTQFVESATTLHFIDIDEEMLYYVEQCVDRSEWMPGDHLVEEHVDFSHLTPIPNQGGTLDFSAMLPGRAYVDDHKFGSAPDNIVYAEENPQLMLYAIGLDVRYWPKYEFDEYVLRINQPRLNHFDEWAVSRKRLLEFGEWASERMHLAWQWDAPRTPGPKQCKFCKVRATCAANAKMQEDLASAMFEDTTADAKSMASFKARLDGDIEPYSMSFKDTGTLTTEQLARLLPYRRMSESWWAAVEHELFERTKAGERTGYKFVEGKSRRKFTSEAQAKALLTGAGLPLDDITKYKLVSPNQAEKLLRARGIKGDQLKELLQGHIYKPPGRATLVPLSDKRPQVQDLSSIAFEDETRETDDDEDI